MTTYVPILEQDHVVTRLIKEKLNSAGGETNIPLLQGNPCDIKYVDSGTGLESSKAPSGAHMEWDVFIAAVGAVVAGGGKVKKGNARSGKLGSKMLPMDSLEGHVAIKMYGCKPGESAPGAGYVIAAVLDWAGICINTRGYLKINPWFLKECGNEFDVNLAILYPGEPDFPESAPLFDREDAEPVLPETEEPDDEPPVSFELKKPNDKPSIIDLQEERLKDMEESEVAEDSREEDYVVRTKNDYLADATVNAFIRWAFPMLDSPGALVHEYLTVKTDNLFRCHNLYDAYQKFKKCFTYTDSQGRLHTAWDRERNQQTVDMLSGYLRESVDNGDSRLCLSTCIAIQNWGGTPGDVAPLRHMEPCLVEYLRAVRVMLDDETFRLDCAQNDEIILTPGFSRIYGLLLDNFLIYESRVAAAICMLVRRFCIEEGIDHVPEHLMFGRPDIKSQARRNPSCLRYRFPVMRSSSAMYLSSNMRASWLMRALLDYNDNSFLFLPRDSQLLALGKALFMIGYEV